MQLHHFVYLQLQVLPLPEMALVYEQATTVFVSDTMYSTSVQCLELEPLSGEEGHLTVLGQTTSLTLLMAWIQHESVTMEKSLDVSQALNQMNISILHN